MDGRGTVWAASGAMSLTGRPERPPLGAPGALIDLLEHAAATVRRRSAGRATVDGAALLGERAALAGLSRQGAVSCGGGTRLLPAADGWVALALTRPEDIAALPAWLLRDIPGDDPWPTVLESVRIAPVAALDERAALLGLPLAALGSIGAPGDTSFELPVGAVEVQPGASSRPIDGAVVLDLSSLWAGPLCGQLLSEAGADVVKVESISRPDGARRGPVAFFDLLNGTKRSVALDLSTAPGRRDLQRLIGRVDIVIESARPRALEQMGLVAADQLRQSRGPRVWVSITSHGRHPDRAQRVGFGDVAAVAGGLVATDDLGPTFLADAVADPVAGLVAAAAALEALEAGGRWLIDAAMAPMAASVAGPLLDVRDQRARQPQARAVTRRAPAIGSDTHAVLNGLLA